jgi:LL-diaminopimelate aminotransferase
LSAQTKHTDIIFFCSPNNPTGAAATRDQLKQLVKFARDNGSLLVYDAAYALYISNPDCPQTIYEIEGTQGCSCAFSVAASDALHVQTVNDAWVQDHLFHVLVA